MRARLIFCLAKSFWRESRRCCSVSKLHLIFVGIDFGDDSLRQLLNTLLEDGIGRFDLGLFGLEPSFGGSDLQVGAADGEDDEVAGVDAQNSDSRG